MKKTINIFDNIIEVDVDYQYSNSNSVTCYVTYNNVTKKIEKEIQRDNALIFDEFKEIQSEYQNQFGLNSNEVNKYDEKIQNFCDDKFFPLIEGDIVDLWLSIS